MAVVIKSHFVSTRNACKLCAPLGAALVFKGIEKAMPLLHGSQGCSTYIRRYFISHFREPVDIASSNFTEESAVFGGGKNLSDAVRNIVIQYQPNLIGIATTCLSETIGEDVPGMVREISQTFGPNDPLLVHVSTPSYSGTHAEGFQAAALAVIQRLSGGRRYLVDDQQVNIFPGMCSPADLRHTKEICSDFGLSGVLLPDYSDTMDGPAWSDYRSSPPGGTSISAISSMSWSRASMTFGRVACASLQKTAGDFLLSGYRVPHYPLGMPIGISETDEFMQALEIISGVKMPEKYVSERGRLVDAITDGHKYVFEKKAFVYGEEDLVLGLAILLSEIGILPVLCVSGGKSGNLRRLLDEKIPELKGRIEVAEGEDFADIANSAERLQPDILIGNSKGYQIARKMKVPMVRVGFPIHDRIGGQRVLHYGYRGALTLYDAIVNSLLDAKQSGSPVGYSYI